MRIAFSGSHRVGKSTLIASLSDALPAYDTVDEPYALLEEDGYDFSDPPSVEDFEAQLRRAMGELEDAGPNVLFDRCPVDILAYLAEHPDGGSFDADDVYAEVSEALERLDLIVYVPIEEDDRIPLPPHEEPEYRAAVDARVRELLDEGGLDVDVPVIVVHGTVDERVAQLIAWVARHDKHRKRPRS